MKIRIKSSGGRGFTLLLPTRALLSPTLIRFGLKTARRHSSSVPDISRKSLRSLRKIILKTRRRNRNWVLVDLESSDGDKVKITL